MRKEIIQLLSGMGYYRLSVQRRKVLRYVLLGSLGAHVIAMLIFGSWVMVKGVLAEKTTFVAQPPARTYEPRKLEHKVKVQKQQRSSSRPSMVPRLVSTKITTGLNLPDIKVDPKLVKTSFQPKFKAVTGMGLGAGLGTGYGAGGFGAGVSTVNFFGIQGKGEKIALLVDVSVSMIEAERGGVEGYARVKQRVEEVIDSLGDASMFSLVVFGDAASSMETEMVIASSDNKKRAKLFLRPFNTEGNWGLATGNISASDAGLKAGGGTTRLDLALTAAFQQGADTILIISDGAPKVKRVFSADQMQAFAMQEQQWRTAHAAEVAAYDAAAAAAPPAQATRVWIPPTPARPPSKSPPKEGQPVDNGAPAREGHWQVVHQNTGPARPQPPPRPDPGWWSLTDFMQHLKLLHQKLYLDKGKKPPIIHSIGYQIDREGESFLKELAREYHGNYRLVKRIK